MKYRFLRYPGGKPKAVTLSYDDGCMSDVRFSDVITAAGLKCTFNLSSTSAMSDEQIKEKILNRGHEVAIHCAHHRAPGAQSAIAGIKEVLECRLALEEKFDMIIRGMAYPDTGITYFTNGATYENIKRYLMDLDVAYARTLGGDNKDFRLPNDWHAWMPTVRHANPEILEYIDEFVSFEMHPSVYVSRRYPRLFYLWGHSFEFDGANNWELLDTICDKLGNKEDTWYATNMEIYEYVKAYDSLIFSADETKIYNPTLSDIWLEIDGEVMCIKSGETKKI